MAGVERQVIRRALLGGSFAAFQLSPAFHLLFSPVLLLAACAAGVVGASLILYGSLFLSSLLLGRAFCGWLCPGCGLQELVALRVRRPVRRPRAGRVKWGIALALYGAAAALTLRAGGLQRVDPAFGIATVVPGPLLLFGHVAIIGALALALGRWASCHAVCWLAPLMIAGTRLSRAGGWPVLRLAADTGACTSCGRCDEGCPMSLPVSSLIERGALPDDECLLCARCADACPSGAVRLVFARERRG